VTRDEIDRMVAIVADALAATRADLDAGRM
jgi:hypothetical protein